MTTRPSTKKKSEAQTDVGSKELLIQAAKRVFAEKGYDGATVKDLADAAGVNVSLVSYHFDGKENLYRTCLEAFGRSNVAAAERVLKPPTSRDEFRLRLQLFTEEFIALNQSEPDVCRILQRDFERPNAIAIEVFQKSFIPMYEKLEAFVAAAKKAGLIRKTVDTEVCTGLVFGSLVHLVKMDKTRQEMGRQSLLEPRRLENTIRQFVEHATFGLFGEEK